jgi:L-ribulose-5-phosphate 3-epimerase
MTTLGVRAHDFGKHPADKLARLVAAHGFSAIQLAPAKAIEGTPSEPGALSPGYARHVRDEFAKCGISVAVLGCYINPIDPHPNSRALQLARFREHLRLARDFGASVVATETGSRNSDWSFHPDNASPETLSELIHELSSLVEAAETYGVCMCIEGVGRHVVSTPKRMKQVIDTIGSPNLQVLFDPVNLLTPDNCARQTELIDEAFDLLGDRIQVIHLKDFRLEGGSLMPARVGTGMLRLDHLAGKLRSARPHIDVLLEETDPSTVGASVATARTAFGD